MSPLLIAVLVLLAFLFILIVVLLGKTLGQLLLHWLMITLMVVVMVMFVMLVAQLLNVSLWPVWRAVANTITAHKFINPEELMVPSLQYDNVQRLDTDGDKEEERILIYRYDTNPGRSPLGATVLNLSNCRPRSIDSYDLFPADRDYLSELGYLVEMKDIPNVGGDSELLFWGVSAGARTELAIFRWYDMNDACKEPDPLLRGYALLGNFRGSGGVEIVDDTVRVLERAFERSQLSVVTAYKPRDGSYRQLPDGSMYAPFARAIEFTYGTLNQASQTYYPEKTVVAFYMNIGLKTDEAKALLDPGVIGAYIDGNNGKDVAEPGQLTSMAEVKEIAYYPDTAKERAHGEIAVEVEVQNRRPDGTIPDTWHRYRVWVRGFANPNAAPYGCEWRIFRFEPLS